MFDLGYIGTGSLDVACLESGNIVHRQRTLQTTVLVLPQAGRFSTTVDLKNCNYLGNC